MKPTRILLAATLSLSLLACGGGGGGGGGGNNTNPPPNFPNASCGTVPLITGTFTRFFFASSIPLVIASVTSFAFPSPYPTTPLPSPSTTIAEKLKRRPPFTTLATRLIATTFSFRSISG